MTRKKYKLEEIFVKLRQLDVLSDIFILRGVPG